MNSNQKTNHLFFTYFKTPPDNKEDSLADFKEKLSELKHFYANFDNSDSLWNQFNKELDRLELDGFTENKKPKDVINQTTITQNADKIVNIEGDVGTANF